MNIKAAIRKLEEKRQMVSKDYAWVFNFVREILLALDEPLPKELKISGYQELALRIQELEEKLKTLTITNANREMDIFLLKKDLHSQEPTLWQNNIDATLLLIFKRLHDLKSSSEPNKHNVPVDDSCHICGFRGGMHHAICSATRNPMQKTTGNTVAVDEPNKCHKCGGKTLGDLKGEHCWECKQPVVKPSDKITISRSESRKWLAEYDDNCGKDDDDYFISMLRKAIEQ